MEYIKIMNIPFIKIDQMGFVDLLVEHVEKQEKAFVVTANPEIVMAANSFAPNMRMVQQATYVTADGIGVVKAAELLGDKLPGRVTGYDTMVELLKVGNERKYRVYLLGAKKETLDIAVQNIHKTYPNIEIVGSHDGYFDWENNTIAEEIAELKPDITFVALGFPRQEKWISENIASFELGVFIGVGGSFDVIAGTVERAPDAWVKLNLEWLYRILKQPSRFKRSLAIPQFMLAVINEKLQGKK